MGKKNQYSTKEDNPNGQYAFEMVLTLSGTTKLKPQWYQHTPPKWLKWKYQVLTMM